MTLRNEDTLVLHEIRAEAKRLLPEDADPDWVHTAICEHLKDNSTLLSTYLHSETYAAGSGDITNLSQTLHALTYRDAVSLDGLAIPYVNVKLAKKKRLKVKDMRIAFRLYDGDTEEILPESVYYPLRGAPVALIQGNPSHRLHRDTKSRRYVGWARKLTACRVHSAHLEHVVKTQSTKGSKGKRLMTKGYGYTIDLGRW